MKDVSVIVTTRNEQANIGACLESVKEQNYPHSDLEILVVDNDSSDKTKEIASLYADQVFDFGPERSAQRNSGVQRASGKYILYLDADMVLSGDLLKECVAKCEKKGYIALYIPEKITGTGFWIKVRDFERSFYNATVIDSVRFVRRDKFLEIRGFDEALTGPEDWDFDRRIKAKGEVGITHAPLYHSEGSFDFQRYVRKKTYYMASFRKYARKWGKNDPVVRKQLGLWYRYFGVFTEGGKWKKLLSHPLLASGMFLLRIAVGGNYLLKRRRHS